MRFGYLLHCLAAKLRGACANAQTRQSLHCLHMQNMDVDSQTTT